MVQKCGYQTEYAGLFVVWAVTDPDAKPGKGYPALLLRVTTLEFQLELGSSRWDKLLQHQRSPFHRLLGSQIGSFRKAK